jgi:hypothetical protein
MTEVQMPKNGRGLKFLVVFMGVLIIIGVAVVIGTIAKRMMKAADKEKKEAELREKSKMPQSEQSKYVALKNFNIDYKPEAGMKVLGAEFGDGAIILRIGTASKTKKIIFLGTDGQVIGTVNIKESAVNPFTERLNKLEDAARNIKN